MAVECTWVAILASFSIAFAGGSAFMYAVKKDYFRNLAHPEGWRPVAASRGGGDFGSGRPFTKTGNVPDSCIR